MTCKLQCLNFSTKGITGTPERRRHTHYKHTDADTATAPLRRLVFHTLYNRVHSPPPLVPGQCTTTRRQPPPPLPPVTHKFRPPPPAAAPPAKPPQPPLVLSLSPPIPALLRLVVWLEPPARRCAEPLAPPRLLFLLLFVSLTLSLLRLAHDSAVAAFLLTYALIPLPAKRMKSL
ncbi:hypothetical protein HanIR_Chr06g0260581 [Helianthus annuus]|nr:hypothetical protein HanIR_Chr06g0260581 [Helianthus annuus]